MAVTPMLDTIAIRADWALNAARPDCKRVALAECPHIKISVKAGRLVWVEASLPKLAFGTNGRVIANQAELDSALSLLRDELSKFAVVPPVDDWQPYRLDLPWNFDLSARRYILAHAAFKVPGILKEPALFDGGHGLSWSGTKSHYQVKLYDKSRERRVAGEVLRAEVSLRGRQLARRLVGDWRSFADLYCTFRNVIASIPEIVKPLKAEGWQEAVGAESLETQQRILVRLAHTPERTFRRYRQRINAASIPGPFSWRMVLPEDGPPPPVHVGPPKPRGRVSRGCKTVLKGMTTTDAAILSVRPPSPAASHLIGWSPDGTPPHLGAAGGRQGSDCEAAQQQKGSS